MENVVREVNSELFEFVAKNVYETYQYLVSMEEVLEYVRLVMVDLAEKKIKVVKQGEVIDMVSKLIINDTKKRGNKIISVGTTSTRTLETIGDENGFVKEQSGWTDIFIYPGYKFKVVDNLITNFHLPESTLLMLVSALAGKEYIMKAYNEAVKEKYKFFSFGDAMIIL